MLQLLQSGGDRWPNWDDEYGDTSELDATSEKDHPAKEETRKSGLSEKQLTDKAYKGTSASGRKRASSSESASTDLMRYASLGTELLAAVIVGVVLMWALSWLIGLITGYRPTWLIAIGVLLGAAAGFLNMYRFVVEENEKEEQKRRGSSE